MACYILSNENRYYAALEPQFGVVPALSATNRMPGVRLSATQEREVRRRRDKTGSRTFQGEGAGVRRRGGFQFLTYLSTRVSGGVEPHCGPLVKAATGGDPLVFAGGTVDSTPGLAQVRTVDPHGLVVGQGIGFGGELRFVTSLVDAHTVELNVPFSVAPGSGSLLGPSVSYPLGRLPKSVSLFDYWSPDAMTQRIVCGAVVDEFRVRVNGDFHELEFRGPARDVLDSASFVSGQGGLTNFPVEPEIAPLGSQPVAGYLGQAWVGASPEQVFSVIEAEFSLLNRVELRVREFGAESPNCFASGQREVRFGFSLYGQDSGLHSGLYQAARQRSPIQVLLQLGQQSGQMMALYMKSYLPEAPRYDDRETRLIWRFEDGRAQGASDDEVYLAFG